MTKKEDRLYILMRLDMASLNPGKAVAQGGHAVSKFICWANTGGNGYAERLDLWLGGRGFGTKICLGVSSDRQLRAVVKAARKKKLPAGIVKDPSYPLTDGNITHHLPLETCGYVFGTSDETRVVLAGLELMK